MKKNVLFIAQVKNIHEGKVILMLDKQQEITIANKFLPSGLQKNDELIVEFYTHKEYQARQKNLAEAIIKEILGMNKN